MRVQPTGEDPVELSPRDVAQLYWEYQLASDSPSRAERLRTISGDLQNAHRILAAAFEQDRYFDEIIVELIAVLVAEGPMSIDDGLGTLAAGPIEDRWNAGDVDVLHRLAARGIEVDFISRLESGIWKATPPRRPKAKPRHPG